MDLAALDRSDLNARDKAAGRGHTESDTQCLVAVPAELILQIRMQYRMRTNLHRAEKAMTLRVQALCRSRVHGWKCNGAECASTMCAADEKEAGLLFDSLGRNGKPHPFTGDIATAAMSLIEAEMVLRKSRFAHEKVLESLASQLPAAEWVAAVRGVGLLALAIIVGEAGDLGNYPNPAKLWKRMGLAVFDGQRQRKVLDAEEALRQGYNPARRAAMWTVNQSLFFGQSGRKETEDSPAIEAGPYRQLYDERKAYEFARDPGCSKGKAHARAKRYAEKRFLLKLWQAWRGEAAQFERRTVAIPSLIAITRKEKRLPGAVMIKGRGGMGSHKHGISGHPPNNNQPVLQHLSREQNKAQRKRRLAEPMTDAAHLKDVLKDQ